MGRASAEGVVPPHSHHAIQIVVGLDGPVGLSQPDSAWTRGQGVMVNPNVAHAFDPMGALLGMLFVDPESREGRWLLRSYREPISELPEPQRDRWARGLRSLWDAPPGAEETAGIIHSLVRGLCIGPAPAYRLDGRVLQALEIVRQMEIARISLEDVARRVHLSPSRFAHLFSSEVGIPFRRYLLWRRMTRAMLAVGHGRTLSAAAHLCGFADSAHLTRTCVQMFGMPPSMMMRAGEFYEIPSPLELPFTGTGGTDRAQGRG